jgi:hypothetical protein
MLCRAGGCKSGSPVVCFGELASRKENPDEPDDPQSRVYANGSGVVYVP